MFEVNSLEFNYRQIAESGQAFRMYEDGLCIAMDKACRVAGNIIDCPDEDNNFWYHYFDFETDYSQFIDKIDPEDEYLSSAAEYGRGIRILNQDPWEMLITFIISQRKNIPAIKNSVEAICRRWGTNKGSYYAFPTPEQLSSASLEELRECSLGYRDEYIYLASKAVNDNPRLLSSLEGEDYDNIISNLMKFKGVGIKVANCVALFGYHKIDAFPVDVWISRVLDKYYSGGFPFDRYNGFAGVMQQYIFMYIRQFG